MPRSKRRKKITFTKLKKKGLEFKQNLVENIRESIEKYERVFVFSVENMRCGPLKDVRAEWKQSRFFFGKCKLIALALGRTEETEIRPNLCKLTNYVKGQRGLLMTNEKTEDVIKWFDEYSVPEFARSGNKATRTVTLPEGQLLEFISSMEPFLRKLGLPTTVKNGKVHLLREHTVCERGQILNPEQAHILKLIQERMAEFRIVLKCVWESDGTIKKLSEDNDADDVEMENGKDGGGRDDDDDVENGKDGGGGGHDDDDDDDDDEAMADED